MSTTTIDQRATIRQEANIVWVVITDPSNENSQCCLSKPCYEPFATCVILEVLRVDYDAARPHSRLSWLTPDEQARGFQGGLVTSQ
jgi:hypothetical protein